MNLIENCRKLIAIDSSPANGNLEAADFAVQLARELGFAAQEQSDILNGIEQKNVIFRHPKSPPGKELLLLTHLDTPDPGSYALWTKTMSNPFKASIYGQEIYGLGVASAKVDFLCKLIAAHKILKEDIKKPFAIAGTYGEHQGMIGALKLIRNKQVKPAFAVVGDATEMKAIYEGAGLTMVEVNVPFNEKEIAYHKMSNTQEGASTQSKIFRGQVGLGMGQSLENNAIVSMFDYISQLQEGVVVMGMDGGVSANTLPETAFLEVDLVGGFENAITQKISQLLQALKILENKFSEYPAEGFSPNTCTLNIGRIRTFKDHVKVEGSCRILPTVPEAVAESWMEELKKACHLVGANFQITLNRRPFATPVDSPIIKMCQQELAKAELDNNIYKTTLCTEVNVLSRLGISSLLIGPGKGVGNTHQPNEVLNLEEAERAIRFYESLLRKYCL